MVQNQSRQGRWNKKKRKKAAERRKSAMMNWKRERSEVELWNTAGILSTQNRRSLEVSVHYLSFATQHSLFTITSWQGTVRATHASHYMAN
jgi:hypothetical protein